MRNELIVSTLLALAASGAAMAQTQTQDRNPQAPQAGLQTQGQGVKVDPSTQPTESMNKTVPNMTNRDSSDMKDAEQHPPTGAIGGQVPPMTPDTNR